MAEGTLDITAERAAALGTQLTRALNPRATEPGFRAPPPDLGYDSRSAPVRDNAEVAISCIQKSITERDGDTPLVVGGLSMGGLVTRYAPAKLETENVEHQVGKYSPTTARTRAPGSRSA